MKFSMKSVVLITALLVAQTTILSSAKADLFNEDFEAGGTSSFYSDGSDPILGNVTDNIINSDDGNGNLALSVDSTAGKGRVIGVLPDTYTLANAGDSLQLSLKLRKTSIVNGVGLILALLNDGGTPISGNDLTATSDDIGFGVSWGQPPDNISGVSVIQRFKPAGSGKMVFDEVVNYVDTQAATGMANSTNSVQNLLLQLTLLSGGDLQVDASLSDPNLSGAPIQISQVIPAANVTTLSFNQIGFGASGIPPNYTVDDVNISYSGSISLIVLSAIGPFWSSAENW